MIEQTVTSVAVGAPIEWHLVMAVVLLVFALSILVGIMYAMAMKKTEYAPGDVDIVDREYYAEDIESIIGDVVHIVHPNDIVVLTLKAAISIAQRQTLMESLEHVKKKFGFKMMLLEEPLELTGILRKAKDEHPTHMKENNYEPSKK